MLTAVILIVAIFWGSTGVTVGVGGRSAPLFAVELWALVVYPLHVLVTGDFFRTRSSTMFALLAGVAVFVEVASLVLSDNPLRGGRLLLLHLVALAVYWYASTADLSQARRILWRLLFTGPVFILVLALPSLLLAGSIGGAAELRSIVTPLGRSNALATFFAMTVVMGVGAGAGVRGGRSIALIGAGIAVLGLMLTASRAGLLVVVVGLAFVFSMVGSQGGNRGPVLGAAVSVVLLGLVLQVSGAASTVTARFQGLADADLGSGLLQNVLERFDYWRVATLMFLDRPLLGHGLGSFAEGYRTLGNFTVLRPSDPHNQLMSMIAETGVLGALAGVALVIFFLRRAWPKRGRTAVAVRAVLVAGAVTAFVHALVEPVFRNPSAAALVALLLGLAANQTFLEREQSLVPDEASGAGRYREL